MASDRELQTLEENEEDLLALNNSIRVEGYRYEPLKSASADFIGRFVHRRIG